MNDPVIKFENYQIEKINYCILEEEDKTDYKMEFSGTIAVSDDEKSGKVTFDLMIPDKHENRRIEVSLEDGTEALKVALQIMKLIS